MESVEDSRFFFLFRSYLSWDSVCIDSNLNVRYTRLVTWHVQIPGNMVWYATPDGMSLLCETWILWEIMMTAVSSMVLIASKIWWWTVDEWILESFFSRRISRVHDDGETIVIECCCGRMGDASVSKCDFCRCRFRRYLGRYEAQESRAYVHQLYY